MTTLLLSIALLIPPGKPLPIEPAPVVGNMVFVFRTESKGWGADTKYVKVYEGTGRVVEAVPGHWRVEGDSTWSGVGHWWISDASNMRRIAP